MAEYGATELANSMRTVRRNTVQIAEEIPEDKYDFVPVPGVRSVREMLVHIAVTNQLHYDMNRDKRVTTLQGYDFGAMIARMQTEEKKQRTKAQIVALLKDEGEQFARWVESLPKDFLSETFTDPTGKNPKSRFEHLLGAKEHEMHHRAQLMLIERMIGITPHLTRAMQERARLRAAQAGQSAAPASSVQN